MRILLTGGANISLSVPGHEGWVQLVNATFGVSTIISRGDYLGVNLNLIGKIRPKQRNNRKIGK